MPVFKKNILFIALGCVGIALLLCFFSFSSTTYSQHGLMASVATTTTEHADTTIISNHIPTPTQVKAIYMSQCVVGTPSFRKKLVDLVETTELNSIIIDIKDFSGTIGFKTTNPLLASASMKSCGAPDMQAFIESLHQKGIYVIGRITVFQDPFYTKAHPDQAIQSKSTGGPWKDTKGLSYIDVSSKPYWDVVVELSKEAHDIGFDELNYDYIRYPSDGKLSDAAFINPNIDGSPLNKGLAVEMFWKYLREHVKPTGVVMSADLFGMTTVAEDDMGIGQQLDRAEPYFDYIAPMVYPSHFATNFGGFGNPNTHVYQVIQYSMSEAVKRVESTTTPVDFIGAVPIVNRSTATSTAKAKIQLYAKQSYPATMLRPWLQDFSYGGTYGPTEVDDQIKATYDVGLNSWMLWSAANTYTTAALVPATQ